MYDKSGPDLRVCANRGPPSHFLIPPPPKQVVSLWQQPRSCTRAGADQLDFVCTDFTGI